jgi:hypothetical protein
MTLSEFRIGFSMVAAAKHRKATKTWETTHVQNLVRHKSGRYYARAFAGSKEKWKSLGTARYSVAKARLGEFLREHGEKQAVESSASSAKITFAQALQIHEQNQADVSRPDSRR